jgi:hypothetical protein
MFDRIVGRTIIHNNEFNGLECVPAKTDFMQPKIYFLSFEQVLECTHSIGVRAGQWRVARRIEDPTRRPPGEPTILKVKDAGYLAVPATSR